MKKYYLILITLVSFITVYSQSTSYENAIRYNGESEDKTYYLYNKKSNPSCHIKIDFFYPDQYYNETILKKVQSLFITQFFGELYANQSAKDAVKQYTKDYIDEYREFFEKSGLYQEEVAAVKERGEDISDYLSFYINEQTMRNTILFNNSNIITQVINLYEYYGGAHGISHTVGHVIDLNTGNPIEYSDVFKEEDQDGLSELLYNAVLKLYGVSTKEELEEMGFFFDTIKPTPNFLVDDKGVTFIYGLYELGAYTLGIVEVFVPYYEIYTYMKPNSPVRKLIK